jgi:acyl-CoA thioester hydrolase
MLPVYKGVAHPWLCDVMGHMTTRHYVAMFDDASYHLLYEIFGWTSESVTESGLGWADVKHVIEYQEEVAGGDILEVRGGIAKVGTKSATFHYEMFNLSQQKIAATLESTAVYFDTRARKAIAITDEMRTQAQNHLLPTN